MNKEYCIDRGLQEGNIQLLINDTHRGNILVGQRDYSGRYCLILTVLDGNWNFLPLLAADLYQHSAGPKPCGYETSQCALQAAKDILAAHGWKESIWTTITAS